MVSNLWRSLASRVLPRLFLTTLSHKRAMQQHVYILHCLPKPKSNKQTRLRGQPLTPRASLPVAGSLATTSPEKQVDACPFEMPCWFESGRNRRKRVGGRAQAELSLGPRASDRRGAGQACRLRLVNSSLKAQGPVFSHCLAQLSSLRALASFAPFNSKEQKCKLLVISLPGSKLPNCSPLAPKESVECDRALASNVGPVGIQKAGRLEDDHK